MLHLYARGGIMEFLDFLKNSKTAYHACHNTETRLLDEGFIKLTEGNKFEIKNGGKYFLTRNNSAILAFTVGNKTDSLSFNITAAHLDSPTFKLKPNFELNVGRYQKLNTEVYGGPIYSTWMDRPLDIAGRVLVKNGESIETKLISFDKAMCLIPNLSIHYDRTSNSDKTLNAEKDMKPIFADNDFGYGNLNLALANKLGVNEDDILGHDLYLALLDRGMLAGANNEFLMAPQIDNLLCAYALTEGLINGKTADNTINVMALYDNEEIGSRTRQGADSDLLGNTLERISLALGKNKEEYFEALGNSYFVSADNAQGFHPNYPEKYDSTNAPKINEGIVIKAAARGSYTSDGLSSAVFRLICEKAQAKYQYMTNRSDMPGGSTLGAIALSHVSIPSVDIGFAQIAMHSAYETAGALDIDEMIKAITKLYSVHISIPADGKVKIGE